MSGSNVHRFQFENSQIAYRKFGNGAATLIAFHGFGQNSTVFLPIEKSMGNRFTIYAIDLFFHGQSQYNEPQVLTKKAWIKMLTAFLEKQHISRFSLLGFSLGGRIALSSIDALADRLDQLILIAPDGITRSFWYRLATGSNAGRWLFQYILNHLSLLKKFGHLLNRLGLLNRTLMRFVDMSLATSAQRNLVYTTWTQLREMRPDIEKVSDLLARHAVRVCFFTGTFDRLVPSSYILPLTNRLHRYELTVLKTSHNRLIELTAAQLM